MSAQVIHPSPDELSAFNLGQIPDAEASFIEQHLEACESCCDTLLGLASVDTFIDLLQRARGEISQETIVPEEPAQRVSSDPEIPWQLARHPRYEIQGLIGKGGMGHVYRARHRLMDRTVALKVIHHRLIRNPVAVDRFHREVKAAARLSHPNIVTSHDADSTHDAHFLVMEFVDGVNLDQVVRQHRSLSVELACNYIHQAACGLQHAHELGMVHRDIKPHNLMLTPKGEVKILDFGLASLNSEVALEEVNEAESRATSDEMASPRLTQAGSMMGTPDFMAPEQALDARAVDIRADIYSLGCTFYMLLAGRPPFADVPLGKKIRAHAEDSPDPLDTLRPDVPKDVVQLVLKMMAKVPGERYQSPGEVVAALRPFLRPRTALPSGARSRAQPVAPGGKTAKWRSALQQYRWTGLGILLVCAAMVGARQFSFLSSGSLAGGLRRTDLAESPSPSGGMNSSVTVPQPELSETTPPSAAPLTLVHSFAGGHVGAVVSVAISPDGRLLVSGGADGTARVWDLATRKELWPLLGHKYDVRTVAFSADSKWILTGAGAGIVRLWTAEGALQDTYSVPAEACWVSSVTFSPTHLQAAAAYVDYTQSENNRVHVLQPGIPDVLHELDMADSDSSNAVHRGRALVFTPDGRHLIVGGESRLLAVFDVESGSLLRRFETVESHVYSLAISADGQRLVSGQTQGNEAILWDVHKGQIIRRFPGHGGFVNAVAISPTGHLVVTGSGGRFGRNGYQRSDDNSLRLWDAATGDCLAVLPVGQRVTSVVFTPDGKSIVSGAGEPTADGKPDLRLWTLSESLEPSG